MITLYTKNTRNITSLLYGFHNYREIKVSRKKKKNCAHSIETKSIDRTIHLKM